MEEKQANNYSTYLIESKLLDSKIESLKSCPLKRKLIEEKRKVTRTDYWEGLQILEEDTTTPVDNYGVIFYETPPVLSASASARVLLVGTKVEIRDFEAVFREKREVQAKEVKERLEKIGSCLIPSNLDLLEYCNSAEFFWRKFFNSDYYLDNQVTIPSRIVATGSIRARNYFEESSTTLKIRERLEEIAEEWKVPLNIIKSWAP